MVDLKEIPFLAVEYYIYIAFAEDNDLLKKYHKADRTIEECIENLVNQIRPMMDENSAKCYGVFFDGEPIGFTVAGPLFLYSFGIDVNFRIKEIVMEWFDGVKKMLNYEFITWLYNENERAILFFKKNGMEVMEQNDQYKTLIYAN